MEGVRWRDLVGAPPVVLTAAVLLAAAFPAAMSAGPPVKPAACPPLDPLAVARAVSSGVGRAADVSQAAVMSAAGELTGQALSARSVGRGPVSVSLPPESFVAPVAGSLLVYGSHSPKSGSQVRAIDLDSGCDVALARPAEIVRSAIMDQTGTALYVHSVTRQGRRDAGVSRHDLATGAVSQAVEPPPVDDLFGPTFTTQLTWSVEGDALAVQSCGSGACRTRILDVASGSLETYAGAGHGALVGVTSSALYALDDAHALPASLVAFSRATGAASIVARDVFEASLALVAGRPALIVTTSAGTQEVAP